MSEKLMTESVWDYPRPPRLEVSSQQIRIVLNGCELVNSSQTYRVLETSHPPVYYIPQADIDMSKCRLSSRQTFCEWKGIARYYSIQVGDRDEVDAAWFYAEPAETFLPIRNYLAFYPSRMDECWIDGEQAQAQPGDFYGGWITSKIVGPFKGGLGTWGW